MLTKKKIKKLIFGFCKKAGRNNRGKITVYHKGSGVKKKYRSIDFLRNDNFSYQVLKIEYDPNRNAKIMFCQNLINQNNFKYFIMTENVREKDIITNFPENSTVKDCNFGDSILLKNLPLGTTVSNIENFPGSGAVFARSAGSMGTLVDLEKDFVHIKLISGEIRKFHKNCRCVKGKVFFDHLEQKKYKNFFHKEYQKAGVNRLKGIRPTVRGEAMNPIDHPHGGATSKGRPSVTPWGIPTKGHKTRKNVLTNKYIVKKRK